MQLVRLEVGPLTPELVERLLATLDAPGRIVVLDGADDRFCDGLDLHGLAEGEGPDFEPFVRLLAALDHDRRPVVALVDGPALGGGCALAAAADLVLATERATFGLPEALWGLSPAIAFPYVARRVSVARARLLGLGLPAIDANEAHRWGLVDEVVDDLPAAFARYARKLLRAAPAAVAEVKHLAALLGPDETWTALARERFDALSATDATRARLAALHDGGVPWAEEP